MWMLNEPHSFRVGMMLDMTYLYICRPVWILYTRLQGCAKAGTCVEICCRVAWSSLNIRSGWLCKGDMADMDHLSICSSCFRLNTVLIVDQHRKKGTFYDKEIPGWGQQFAKNIFTFTLDQTVSLRQWPTQRRRGWRRMTPTSLCGYRVSFFVTVLSFRYASMLLQCVVTNRCQPSSVVCPVFFVTFTLLPAPCALLPYNSSQGTAICCIENLLWLFFKQIPL